MNAAILLMASAVTAGQPAPAPAAPAPAGPAVVAGSGGCGSGGCGGPVACGCDVACSKKHGWLDKIKSRSGGHRHHCHAAPACDTCSSCAPAPAPAPAPCATCCAPAPCNDCCGSAPRQSILDRLKCHFAGKKKHHGCNDCAPACDGCGGPAVGGSTTPPTSPAPGGSTPAPVPSPMPKVTPKAEVVVPGVVTPVSGPRVTGTTSPY